MRKRGPCFAYALRDLVVTLSILVVGGLFIIGILTLHRERQRHLGCIQNLKNLSLGFRMFASDDDRFPMSRPATALGTMDFAGKGQVFRHFQALSNELGSPTFLICPFDDRRPVNDFQLLQESNISYFVGLDSAEWKPETLLVGDRHITEKGRLLEGVFNPRTNSVIAWREELHKPALHLRTYLFQKENIGFVSPSDGSVHSLNNSQLMNRIAPITNRLEFPQSNWPPR